MRIFFCLLLVFVVSISFGQRLAIYKTFGGVVIEMNDSVQISMKQTMMILYKHQPAYEEMKKARSLSTVSALMGFSGAAMVAIPAVSSVVGSEPEWGLAAGGGALIAGAFFFHRAFKSRALDAIDLYNAQLPQKTSRIKPELIFYGTGAKLVIRF
jgi:hypothetical protein